MKTSLIIIFFAIALSGCKKLIEVDSPENQLTTEKVFSDSTAVVSALTNLYSLYARTAETNYTINISLYADELSSTTGNTIQREFQINQVSQANATNLTIWRNQYNIIYGCNDMIENLPRGGLPAARIKQWIAEVKFLRAFSYYYLINLYDNIPLITTTNVDQTRVALQSPREQVLDQITKDLDEAKSSISTRYEGAGKVRANLYSVMALEARIFLLRENWAGAEQASAKIISSSIYGPLEPLDNVFKANSKESILQFQTQTGVIAGGGTLIPASNTVTPSLPLTSALYDGFESADQRKTKWVGTSSVTVAGATTTYRYPYKYKNRVANLTAPEYLTVFRLAEQYLIRAEARTRQNNLTGAVADLNVVRKRAGLDDLAASDQATVMSWIVRERQHELFTEWGHRFIDLKRFKLLDQAIKAFKGDWPAYASALPIPYNELLYNRNLIQNPGYNN